MKKKIYTIGHSTRKIEYFLDLLKSHGIEMLVDVRTIPKSRHNPQFNKIRLRNALRKEDIFYTHLAALGGLRHTTKNSMNLGWQNLSFRGYADYMQMPEFWQGMEELEKISKKYKTAIMCAEAVPWGCHRSLIADALTTRDWKVFHITSKKKAKQHELISFLKIDSKGNLTYP